MTGFWEDFKTLLEEDTDTEWGFIENASVRLNNRMYNAYNYLHGFCDIFAQCLHERYGYSMEYIFQRTGDNEDDPVVLIHAYCKTVVKGKDVYIDVRGIQGDYDVFVDEFRDFFDFDDYTYTTQNDDPLPGHIYCDDLDHKKAAEKLIEEYREYYDIRFFEQKAA